MKCYLFGNVIVTDPERFAEYLEKVPGIIARYGGRYIVRGGAVYPLEGDLGVQRMIMIEFESREAAQRFYDSEEYALLKTLRMETAQSQVMFADAIGSDYVVGPDGDINTAVHRQPVFEPGDVPNVHPGRGGAACRPVGPKVYSTDDKTRALVHKFIEYNEAGRFEECYRMLNPDARYTLIGKTEASDTYVGRDDVFARLAPLLSNFTERPQMKFSHVLVDGDQAFLRASGKGGGIYGPYEQPFYGFYFRVEGDGFAEMIEYLDPVQLEISLFGKKLVDA